MRPLIIAVACFDHFSCPLQIKLVHYEIVIAVLHHLNIEEVEL
jgi:hypothetical protein